MYAAGFTTAFGADGVAANLGAYTENRYASLLMLGALLALFPVSRVVASPCYWRRVPQNSEGRATAKG